MVAITVILAAVIGAFVLEIGDQQETAPSASFESEQSGVFLNTDTQGGHTENITEVRFSHVGGSTVDVSQVNIKINGNGSVWGVKELTDSGANKLAHPQPNIRETWGTNQQVEFTSGQTWNFHGFGPTPAPSKSWSFVPSDENLKAPGEYQSGMSEYCFDNNDLTPPPSGFAEAQQLILCNSDGTNQGTGLQSLVEQVNTGDTVNLIWKSESGGKTQTLFKYNVQ